MVPQLASREGWKDWERKMLAFISAEEFDDLLGQNQEKPTELREGETQQQLDDRVVRWEDRQEQACACLMYRLNCTARSLLDGKEENLHKRMAYLRHEFGLKDHDLLHLYARFTSLKLSDCVDVRHFSHELMDLRDNIKLVDPTARFLDGLGDEYARFAMDFSSKFNIVSKRDPDPDSLDTTIAKPYAAFRVAHFEALAYELIMRDRQARQATEELNQQAQANLRRRRRERARPRTRPRPQLHRNRV